MQHQFMKIETKMIRNSISFDMKSKIAKFISPIYIIPTLIGNTNLFDRPYTDETYHTNVIYTMTEP